MTPRGSISALAVSFALLGLVAWMAAAHPAGGPLFASGASRVDLQPASSALPGSNSHQG